MGITQHDLTSCVWCQNCPESHVSVFPSNLSAIMSISARTLRAPQTPPHSLCPWPGAPGSSALGSQPLPGLCCSCACLQSHLLGEPWTSVGPISTFCCSDWVHPLAASGAVPGPHPQPPALQRPCGTVLCSVRTQPQFSSLFSFLFLVKFKPLSPFFLNIRPYSPLFLCPDFLPHSPQDIILAALFFSSLNLSFYDTFLFPHFSPFKSSCFLNPTSELHLIHLFKLLSPLRIVSHEIFEFR